MNEVIPHTDAFRVWTVFGEHRKYIGSPKGLFRSGVVARASIFQISSHNRFQYIIRLIKEKIHYTRAIQNIFKKAEICFVRHKNHSWHKRLWITDERNI